MKKKLSAVLLAAYLMAGCSSGGGTSGAGGGGLVTAGEFLLAGSATVTGSISIDTVQDICSEATEMAAAEFEDFTSKLGTFTVTITNIADLTGGIFPSGIILKRYTVSFVARSPGAPVLSNRIFTVSSSTINGNTNTVGIIIADLAVTKREAFNQNPGGVVHSYSVNITMQGTTLSGDAFSLTATVFVEMGNFDNC